jgi:N-acetylglucosamine-6-phosphate deacetylase
MPNLILKNAEIVFPNETLEKNIFIENGRFSTFFNEEKHAAEILDLSGFITFAGFIDAHIHGAVGVDVNAASVDDLYKMAKFLAEKGTTAWLPTFVPDSDETYERVVGEIEKLIEIQANEPIAQIVVLNFLKSLTEMS